MARTRVRRNYFIDRKFQINFVLKFCAVMVLASLLMASLSILFTQDSTTVAIENTKVVVKNTADFIFPIMAQTFIIVVLASSISVGILTLIASHRIVGPAYRLKKEIELLKDGNLDVSFRLRTKDELKALAASLASLAKSLKNKNNSLKTKALELKAALQSNNQSAIKAKIEEIETAL